MENLPPFYVGQKVISLIDGYQLKKGDIKTVISIYKHCCTWHVDVGIISPVTKSFTCKVHGTPFYVVKGQPLCAESILFAPVQENFQSISLEKVLEEETKLIGVN